MKYSFSKQIELNKRHIAFSRVLGAIGTFNDG